MEEQGSSYVPGNSKYRRPMNACKIVIFIRYCSTLADLVSTDSKFIDFLKTTLTFDTMIVPKCGFYLTNVLKRVPGAEL